MTESPNDKPRSLTDDHDPLLAALRQLPSLAAGSEGDARRHRQALARYVRGFDGSARTSSAFAFVGRVTVPLFLAATVGIYMTWAIAAAVALVQ